tara:strand:- start:1411 stop:2268 length:858 start_codon:yes stop_codon:yes gene_type:complete
MSHEQAQVEMTNEEYHKLPGVSKSKLDVLIEDPREYEYQFLSGEYIQKPKSEFDIGSAVHGICLEGVDRVAVIPASVLAKKDGKESAYGAKSGGAWKEWSEANKDKLQLKAHEYDLVMRCVDSVMAHPMASALIKSPGKSEAYYRTELSDLGLIARCKLDRIVTYAEKTVVVDLKTTSCTLAKKFVKSIDEFGYDRQEAFYRMVLERNDIYVDEFIFIAVKTDAPYCVDCYTIRPDWVMEARQEVVDALKDLARRTIENDWKPAAYNGVRELAPPNYRRYRGEYK